MRIGFSAVPGEFGQDDPEHGHKPGHDPELSRGDDRFILTI